MRRAWFGLAAVVLAGCDSGTVPSPAERELRASTPQPAENEVVFRAEGFVVGSEAFYFAAGRNEVETALTRVLGESEGSAVNEECGAGPIDIVRFPGDVMVNFQERSLVGWNTRSADDAVQVEGDVQVGTSRDEAEEVAGYLLIPESTLGEEFALGDRIGGFIEDGKVAMLYSGTQCFFR